VLFQCVNFYSSFYFVPSVFIQFSLWYRVFVHSSERTPGKEIWREKKWTAGHEKLEKNWVGSTWKTKVVLNIQYLLKHVTTYIQQDEKQWKTWMETRGVWSYSSLATQRHCTRQDSHSTVDGTLISNYSVRCW